MEANSVNSIKMCNSLMEFGISVKIHCELVSDSIEMLKSKYGFSNDIKFRNNKLLPKTSFKILNFLYRLISDMILSYKLNKDSSDLIFSRNIFSLLLVNKAKFAYELHKPPRTLLEKFTFNLICERSNLAKLICISASLKNIILDKYPDIPKNSFLVCHDGAEIYQSDCNKPHEGNLRVGYAGSLYKGRGIRIIKFLAESLPNIDFVIIGGKKNQFSSDCKNILHIPFVPHSKISPLLCQCDILLAPYQQDLTIRNKENSSSYLWMSPLKIFEYMAIGKPILCSSFKVLKEVLKDGYNCILIDHSDKDKWLKSLKKLIRNESLMDSLGKNAKKDLEENFTWNNRAERIIKACKIGINGK